MKIYFTCSTAEFKQYRENYWAIRNYLVDNGHILTRDWLAEADGRLKAKQTELGDIKEIYKACVQAIREAELVIIDDTVSNFSTGHQITLALQLRKPTLVLWQGGKHRQFKHMFIHGIESDILEIAEYNGNNFSKAIQAFISKYEDTNERNRFHLVLNGIERNYLDWAQYVKGKSRTKVIRAALDEIMDNDVEYRDYLADRGSINNSSKAFSHTEE